MAEEGLSEYLERRIRETLNRIASTRAVLTTLEDQLDQLQTAQSAISGPGAPTHSLVKPGQKTLPISEIGTIGPAGINSLAASEYVQFGREMARRSLADLSKEIPSIPELALLALQATEAVIRYGKTNSEIRQFIRDTTGREVERTSLSPALSRLRDEGRVESLPEGKWRIAR